MKTFRGHSLHAGEDLSAILEARRGKSVNYAAITIPFDSVKVWKTRRALRVKGEINGFPFRTSLLPTGDGHHVMVVNKAMQKGARIRPGMGLRLVTQTSRRA